MQNEIGRATARSARQYKVLWDVKTREVWVQRVSAVPFSDPSPEKCDAKAERAEDAMHVAHAFLHDK